MMSLKNKLMLRYMIDTNIVSYAIRPGNIPLSEKLLKCIDSGQACISVITRAEIRAGQALMHSNDRRHVQIDWILNQLLSLDLHSMAADIYGQLDSILVKTGQSIGVMDTQIAAHALAENLILVTHNLKHFSRIPNLKLEDWTQA